MARPTCPYCDKLMGITDSPKVWECSGCGVVMEIHKEKTLETKLVALKFRCLSMRFGIYASLEEPATLMPKLYDELFRNNDNIVFRTNVSGYAIVESQDICSAILFVGRKIDELVEEYRQAVASHDRTNKVVDIEGPKEKPRRALEIGYSHLMAGLTRCAILGIGFQAK